jgi:hypothetical protein
MLENTQDRAFVLNNVKMTRGELVRNIAKARIAHTLYPNKMSKSHLIFMEYMREDYLKMLVEI